MTAVGSAMLLAATHATTVDIVTFAVAGAIVLAGAVGVVVARNPVHAALMLVMTLFGVAVIFLLQRDDFLAAVQVIVYAGAIVVLFLFVIMFLGVDRPEDLSVEPLRGQRPLAVLLIALGLIGTLLLGFVSKWTTGAPSVAGAANGPGSNVDKIGRSVFTTYLFPFEITAALLVIAVVGAVVLARRPPSTGERPAEAERDALAGTDAAGGGTADRGEEHEEQAARADAVEVRAGADDAAGDRAGTRSAG